MKKIQKGPMITCLSLLFAGLIFTTGCKKKSDGSPEIGPVPEVATGNYSNVLLSTVEFTGNVTADHGYIISKRGFCWSSDTQAPTIRNDTTVAPEGRAGSFNDTIKGLKGQTHYFIRAYATNINGTGYGDAAEVTTLDSTITDIDNNHYRIVQIGTQIWMAGNLKTTRLNDGTAIPLITDGNAWDALTTPGYCLYANDPNNNIIYGALYNWYTVNTGKLAPAGWHIPSDDEWTALSLFLGGDAFAGGKLKETGTVHWKSPNSGATNSSGFNSLPGGTGFIEGSFNLLTTYCFFWSSSAQDESLGWARVLSYDSEAIESSATGKPSGFSIRCVRN